MQDYYNNRYGGSNMSGRDYSRGRDYDNYGRNSAPRPFGINEVVRHIGTGIKLTVIGYGREQVECRKPDLSSGYFYVHELASIEDDEDDSTK